MGRIAGKYIGKKHKAAEVIVNTGRIPDERSDKLKKISSVSKTQGSSKKILGMEKGTKTKETKKFY